MYENLFSTFIDVFIFIGFFMFTPKDFHQTLSWYTNFGMWTHGRPNNHRG